MNKIVICLNVIEIYLLFKIFSCIYKYENLKNLVKELKYYEETNYKKIDVILIEFKKINNKKNRYNILLLFIILINFCIKSNLG